MQASIIRLGALLLAGALSACATSGGMGMTGRGGSGFESVSSPERIDACAGALIALRGATEELRAELDETRGRKLVWREERDTSVFGRTKHQVDWNPALEYLAIALAEVDARISADLTTAASAHAAPTSQGEAALMAAVTRSGDVLRVIGVYLAAIRAAQYALHDAPRYAVGGLGFNDGIVDRVERLRGSLESLRSGKPLTRADGERRVGLTGPKERIPSLTGTAEYRVPDGLTKLTIEEVKNAVKLSVNNQLRDFLLYAKATGRTFILYVRSNTELVGDLKKWEAEGLVKVARVL